MNYFSEEMINNDMSNTSSYYEDLFIEHYFRKKRSDLTEQDKHEMDCFGIFGMPC
jgi:hypothetical protein